MISKLKLPLEELKILYTRHLLLKELFPQELSLLILSLCFIYRKQNAFDIYLKYSYDQKECEKNVLPLLQSLEDRFINGIVSYKIGYCGADKFYYNAYNIFIKQPVLCPQELFYMGAIYEYGKGGVIKNYQEAFKFYKLSSDEGYIKADINIGCFYRDGSLGITKDYATAITYFEKAAKLGSPGGKCHLAYMLQFGLGIDKNFLLSKELYISSAKDGNIYAIETCKRYKFDF